MNIENTIKIEELATKAALASRILAEVDAAKNAELEAETAVLEAAIEAVKPVLKRLVKKLVCTSHSSTDGHSSDSTTHFKESGLVLTDSYDRTGDTETRGGAYLGSRLVILTDGSLVQLSRSGCWSAYQGEPDMYEVTMKQVTPREAMDSWKLGDAIESMHKALQAIVNGNHQKAITASRARVAVLRAAVQGAK